MRKPYEINFVTNTITVTAAFRKAAGQIGSPEFSVMLQLRGMNMDIVEKTVPKRKNTQITYKMMEKYIELLDEAEQYKAEFAAVKKESKSHKGQYNYVAGWFKERFPSYGKQPERDRNFKIVNVPAENMNNAG